MLLTYASDIQINNQPIIMNYAKKQHLHVRITAFSNRKTANS